MQLICCLGRNKTSLQEMGFIGCKTDATEVNMSIEGMKFCDLCGGAIFLGDVTAVKIEEDGHFAQQHFHNRHAGDCLAQKLAALEDQFAHADAVT